MPREHATLIAGLEIKGKRCGLTQQEMLVLYDAMLYPQWKEYTRKGVREWLDYLRQNKHRWWFRILKRFSDITEHIDKDMHYRRVGAELCLMSIDSGVRRLSPSTIAFCRGVNISRPLLN